MKSKIKQFAKNNNMEVGEVYFSLAPVVGFILFLILVGVLNGVMYPIVGVTGVVALYMAMKFLKALLNGFNTLLELVFTKPIAQN